MPLGTMTFWNHFSADMFSKAFNRFFIIENNYHSINQCSTNNICELLIGQTSISILATTVSSSWLQVYNFSSSKKWFDHWPKVSSEMEKMSSVNIELHLTFYSCNFSNSSLKSILKEFIKFKPSFKLKLSTEYKNDYSKICLKR